MPSLSFQPTAIVKTEIIKAIENPFTLEGNRKINNSINIDSTNVNTKSINKRCCLLCKEFTKNHSSKFNNHLKSHNNIITLLETENTYNSIDSIENSNIQYFKFKQQIEEFKYYKEVINNYLKTNIDTLDTNNYNYHTHDEFVDQINSLKEKVIEYKFQQRLDNYFHNYLEPSMMHIITNNNSLEDCFNDIWISFSPFTGTPLHVDTNDTKRNIRNVHLNMWKQDILFFYAPY